MNKISKIQSLSVAALLSMSSVNVLGSGVPVFDVGKLKKDFCIYEGKPYSIGSIVKMSAIKQRCTASLNIPKDNPSWKTLVLSKKDSAHEADFVE